MKDNNGTYDYDQQIEDLDEIQGTDIKINPDFYIHNAVVKAQQALVSPDLRAGLIQFRMLVENIEILCKAANMIPVDYDTTISEFMKNEHIEGNLSDTQSAKLANFKMGELFKIVFKAKVNTNPMRVGEKKQKVNL